ncbi:MAG: class 1 fructose-bisphosphatase [Nitrospira sp.]|nr:class 1 fructose-bisphosphatase [Nitrospira sp.]
MREFPLTLSQFIIRGQAASREATGEFSTLLTQIGLVGKLIAHDLRRAGLIPILGATGGTNVQGEAVKKLDEIANDDFVKVFRHSGCVCAVASEEMERPLMFQENWPQGKYLLLFDPLDGSSNTETNMPLGAIFSVLKHGRADRLPQEEDLLRPGIEQIAAGYLLYGSSTMLVFTLGQGVYGFTLDPDTGEYLLSHDRIKMPDRGKVYAANEGNVSRWQPGVKRYVESLKVNDKATGRPYSSRYSGCLVADVHRLLLGGGIYLYPEEVDKPEGKLRLLYEANPLAFVVEQTGGKASTGTTRILEIAPKTLHQRVPLIIGSRLDVEEAESFIQGKV